MRKLLLLLSVLWGCLSCADSKNLVVEVKNTLDFDRKNEIVELPMDEVAKRLKLPNTAQLVVTNENGEEVAYQITSDNLLIFLADVKAASKAKYSIEIGKPKNIPTSTTGRRYPNRLDDMAWENDLVGFRAYGPAMQANGERGFGYDLWLKRGTYEPVLESFYEKALDPLTAQRIKELRKTDPKAAGELSRSISYHLDHGYGMDCYAVGPTLGAGTTALVDNGDIVYPWCYKEEKILDNGPLRFSVKLTYNPLTVGKDTNVVETRIITLDKGQHMNRTEVRYEGLSQATTLVAGMGIHEPDSIATYTADKDNGFVSYIDPTQGPDNGKVFVGIAMPNDMKDAKAVYFSPEEKAKRNKTDGQLLAYTTYVPGTTVTYYWGFAWNRGLYDIKSFDAWNAYLTQRVKMLRTPLVVKIK